MYFVFSVLPAPVPKRKATESAAEGSGGKTMKIKTEDGGYITVKSGKTDKGVVDLTSDHSNDTETMAEPETEHQSDTSGNKTVQSREPSTSKTVNNQQNLDEGVEKSSETGGESSGTSAEIENDTGTAVTNGLSETTEEKDNNTADKTDNKGDSKSEIKLEVKKEMVHTLSQTVPVVVKFASPEEIDLLNMGPLEQRNALLAKCRELDDTKQNLVSLQKNIWQLLKIIVPDFDYGEPENIEKIIMDFIRVNNEEEQPSSSSTSAD